jgi:hypothetical protein
VLVAGSDGTFYQVKASGMSLMELIHDALLYPRETKCAIYHSHGAVRTELASEPQKIHLPPLPCHSLCSRKVGVPSREIGLDCTVGQPA